MCIPETSASRCSRDLHRQCLDVELVDTLGEDTAFLHADRVAVSVNGTVAWIGWSRRTSCRSTCVIDRAPRPAGSP